jgi:hypothetical protein
VSETPDSGHPRTQREVLAETIRLLQDLDIPYMLAGSLASSVHGEPRTTLDIDLVIDLDTDSADTLDSALAGRHFYVDVGAAQEALRQRGQFNAIDQYGGWKVDLIIRKDRPFSRSEFARRVQIPLGEVSAHVATAEDTIIAKLEWARPGQSERQLRDVAGILRARGEELDRDYLAAWIADLGLAELWERAVEMAT